MKGFAEIGYRKKAILVLSAMFLCLSALMAVENGLTEKEIVVLLDEHNRVRRDAGAKPLVWSESISAYAARWGEHLAKTGCKMEHRPPSGKWKQRYGENLFIGSVGYYSVADAVKAWESEKKNYKGGPIKVDSSFHQIGHYTQMIWRRTAMVGCAKVECKKWMIVVCNYDPPGNTIGRRPDE